MQLRYWGVCNAMGADLFAIDHILGFLLVLTRVAGVFVFVPLPGVSSSPATAKIVLSIAVSACLFPLWSPVTGLDQSVVRLAGYVVMEVAVGMVLGLTVAFAIEALKLAAQIAGLHAGFGFAQTIDPSSAADTSLLLVIAEMFGGLLFFAAGFDRQVLAILAGTIKTLPPGQAPQLHGSAEAIVRLAGELFVYGLRLALPLIAFLVLVDLTLGFLGRVNSHLQLLTLAFPVKIVAALALFAVLTPVYARVYHLFAQHSLETAGRILLRR
jgi:flagellar biosynthesis protein FliR